MKLAIMALVGLLIGLAGGTGGMVYKNRKAAAALAAGQEKAGKDGAKAAAASGAGTADSAGATEGGTPPEEGARPEGQAAEPNAPVPVVASAALTPNAESGREKPAEHATPPVEAAKAPDAKADPAAAKTTEKGTEKAEAKPAAVRIAEVRPASARGAVASDAAERTAAFKQLARIFGNMKPADAVKVLAFMTDDEVEGVVRQFAPRQAAELLAAFPKERAAVLSRRLLVPKAS